MSSVKDIWWLSSPLGIDRREHLLAKTKYKPLKNFLDPSKEVRFFHKIKHWTLQIGDKCYELWPKAGKKIQFTRFTSDLCEPQERHADEWHKMRADHGIRPEVRKVGQTRMMDEEIKEQCEYTAFC